MKAQAQIQRRPADEWRMDRDACLARVRAFVERRRYRRSRGLAHPVEDFIWEYYSLRGSRLMQWHSGAGVLLLEATEEEFPASDGYIGCDGGRILDPEPILARRASGVAWIRTLLETVETRPPVFSCLGLHEWAMVYEEKDVRHTQLPLRLPHAEIRILVETLNLTCTHYDAFRFFSTSARPLNANRLRAETRTEHEQPGCLHVNMDLFKWCMKLQPLVPSTLTVDCFELACRAREVDMRASPYDLGDFGGAPIRIETPAGRADYVREQQAIAGQAVPLRRRLIESLENIG